MKLRATVVWALLPWAGALVASEPVPGCFPPTSPRYQPLPFPYPQTDSEVVADFEHCYLLRHETNLTGRLVNGWQNLLRRLAGIRGRSGPRPEDSRLARLIRAGAVRYRILAFEDWQDRRRPQAQGPRQGYLVRIFEAGLPENELARWALGEDGGWRTGGQLSPPAAGRASAPREIPGRLEPLAEARRRLERRWPAVEDLRYVVFRPAPFGPIRSCLQPLRPCLAFTAAGERFLYSPEEARVFRIRTELGTFQIVETDQVSTLESQLAIARAIDSRRDLVFGMGQELGIAREILYGAPPL